jgi:type IX secretion system PorP/SprF family membrane protein
MKKFIYILMLIAICTVQNSSAQQDPNFTLYNFNMNIINPAFAGSSDIREINIGYRSQWVGISDSPNTQALTYTAPLKNNLGLGISVIRDQVFVLQETDITLDISYKLKISETYDLYFGVKGGASMINIDLTNAGSSDADPLFAQNESFINPQFGAGMFLKHDDFYLSISSPNFLNGKRYEKQGNAPSAAVDNLHMYYGFGYHFDVSDNLRVTPGVMHRNTQGAPPSTDINATVKYNTIQAGMNYRINEMFSIFTMFNILENIQFGAAYDFTTSKLNQVNDNGSMEVMLKFQLSRRESKKELLEFKSEDTALLKNKNTSQLAFNLRK